MIKLKFNSFKSTSLLIIFVIIFLISGCASTEYTNKSDDDFITVASITFTTAGNTKTLYSSWYITREKYEIATKEEYDNANKRLKSSVMAGYDVNVNTLGLYDDNLFSGNLYSLPEPLIANYTPRGILDEDVGKYFYIYAHDLGAYNKYYFKTKIKGYGTHYLQVKIKNDTTIVIKTSSGNETLYTVTSYSIKK